LADERTVERNLQRLREMCLAFPESSEAPSWGHPNFKAGRKVFAAWEHVGGQWSIAFRLDPVDVDLLLQRPGFFATPYGRGQWASLRATGRIDWSLVRRLLDRSYRIVALQRMVDALDGTVARPSPSIRRQKAERDAQKSGRARTARGARR
jgi:predicted DNA-binding protein (MmcQ/YjbR family)